jgi:hypothetical protein
MSLRKSSNIAFVIQKLNRGEEVIETTTIAAAAAADDDKDLPVSEWMRRFDPDSPIL